MSTIEIFKNNIVEIPINHKELSKVIKRVTKYKQLSKQLSKQLQYYKLSILQNAEREIEKHKQNGNHDKYISFKIGDEFTNYTGKGSHNQMIKNGVMVGKESKNAEFNIPIYTRTLKDDHIVGYGNEKAKEFGKFFKGGPYIKYSIEGAQGVISKE